MSPSDTQKTASGCLFGLALGDALAAPTEFIRDTVQIEARFGKGGPQKPETRNGRPARVTDDTQMALAVGEALARCVPPYEVEAVEGPLREAFIAWLISPDNTRAPGMTCMKACRNLMDGLPWTKATQAASKGCGANMRVAPVGLLPQIDDTKRACLSQFQAALTHGHPTGLAASDLTAQTVAWLRMGETPNTILPRLQDYAVQQRKTYHAAYLGDLWREAGKTSGEAFIRQGWNDCLAILSRIESAVNRGDRDTDPCLATGEGWVAEEAFATGLLCFLLFPNEPVAALRRASVTSGDSDSLACLAGAFAGAYHGISAWPADWVATIEYRARLAYLGDLWD